MKQPHIFGIRHLSPASAFHLIRFLTEKKPRLVFVEAPSDFQEEIEAILHPHTRPPIAILAYTTENPVRTIFYPLAEYSPEYQAILWCKNHHVSCRFMDLPSEVFLALPREIEWETEGEEKQMDVYQFLDQQAGEDGHETFWERTFEQLKDTKEYQEGVNFFGKQLRNFSQGQRKNWPETIVRESYMRKRIQEALEEGYAPEDIVVVTGAYHGKALSEENDIAMTQEEWEMLPRIETKHTLMPYSDYRLSTRSGYGAGNHAPAYYRLLWEAIQRGDHMSLTERYLAGIAAFQRKEGHDVSTADVIEAVRLSNALAVLRGGKYPALRDLRDGAITCFAKGNPVAISLAVAAMEIGTGMGKLPKGVSNTSIQEDFYRKIRELKLEKYYDVVQKDLRLDLREKRSVSTKAAAFLDLHRSFFLHRLRILEISFVRQELTKQEDATWAEYWVFSWTPQAEIELVEAALKGDTIQQVASFVLKERVEHANTICDIAKVIEDAFTCGMPKAVLYATTGLQSMAVEAASLAELSKTAHHLSMVLQYGDLRRLDASPLIPVLHQIFYRSCLLLLEECICDYVASKEIMDAMERMNRVVVSHTFLEEETWIDTLREISKRDDLNTRLSGYAMAILLEQGKVENETLKLEVSRRLSKGVPADLAAGWFEGFSMKNHYILIAKLSLWESLDQYLKLLNEEEFKRALVFLRRAFADFTAMEKDEIAENLGELWGKNTMQVSATLNANLKVEEQQIIESLEDFDFDL